MVVAENLINATLPVLHPSDTGKQALALMDRFRVSHLAVVSGEEYLGLINDKFIGDLKLAENTLESEISLLSKPHVHTGYHLLEVASLMQALHLSLVPVLDEEHHYKGALALTNLSGVFFQMVSLQDPGGILVLQTPRNNYSTVQISQIIEGNDARILCLFVSRIPESDNLEVTLKLDKVDLSSVIQTFTRYGYQISAAYMDDSVLYDLYEDRMEQFLRYINV